MHQSADEDLALKTPRGTISRVWASLIAQLSAAISAAYLLTQRCGVTDRNPVLRSAGGVTLRKK